MEACFLYIIIIIVVIIIIQIQGCLFSNKSAVINKGPVKNIKDLGKKKHNIKIEDISSILFWPDSPTKRMKGVIMYIFSLTELDLS